MLLEASDGVGGRVRTDEHPQGYKLDRGFQVFFTAYPAAARHLDYSSLDLRTFDPGGLISYFGKTYPLTDPLRDPTSALPATLSPAATPLDKLRVLLLKYELGSKSIDELFEPDEVSIIEYLRRKGFSERVINLFFRPFFGGVLLDRGLEASEGSFRYVYGMLSRGQTVLPAGGIGRIPEQLAAHLPTSALRLRSPADELLREGGRVKGVRSDGEEIEAETVVLAVPAPEARRLAGVPAPEGQVSTVTL